MPAYQGLGDLVDLAQLVLLDCIRGNTGEYLVADIGTAGKAGTDQAVLVVLGVVGVAHW